MFILSRSAECRYLGCAGEGEAVLEDVAASGGAVGRAGLGVAGRDTVGVTRQPAWARVPRKEKAGAVV